MCTHRAMDKQKLSKNSKVQLKNDQNLFSFLMTSFYSLHYASKGRISLPELPPTHLSGLLTLMTLVFLFMLQLFPQFEWFPITPKLNLLLYIFGLFMSYFSYVSNQVLIYHTCHRIFHHLSS